LINSNINQVIRAVTKATDKLDTGARMARDEMMNTLTQYAKEEIKGRRQPGERAVSGEPPMNRTGNLRRSIKGERYRQGYATYSAVVGPTIVYGRALELGGKYAPKSWRDGQKFPYMKPAFEKFQRVAMSIMRKHLSLKG
jgi:phage gpG-like protein